MASGADGNHLTRVFASDEDPLSSQAVGASDPAASLEERMINVCEMSRIVNVWLDQCRSML